MKAFLTFILITVLVMYLIGIIGRWWLRKWIYRKQREFENRFGNTGGYRQYTWTQGGPGKDGKVKEEGEVKVQKTTHAHKKVSGCVGDYVDYEEVETGDDNQ